MKPIPSIIVSTLLVLVLWDNLSGQVNHPVYGMQPLADQIHDVSSGILNPRIAIVIKNVNTTYKGLNSKDQKQLEKFIQRYTNFNDLFEPTAVSQAFSAALLSSNRRRNTVIQNRALIEQIIRENEIDEREIHLYNWDELNEVGQLLQANILLFLSVTFDIGGLKSNKIRVNWDEVEEVPTYFLVEAQYGVELYRIREGIQAAHPVHNNRYEFRPESLSLNLEVNPFAIRPVPVGHGYNVQYVQEKVVEIDVDFTGENLAGRILLIKVEAFDQSGIPINPPSMLHFLNTKNPLTEEVTLPPTLSSSRSESITVSFPLASFKERAKLNWRRMKKKGEVIAKSQYVETDIEIRVSLWEIDLYSLGKRVLVEVSRTFDLRH